MQALKGVLLESLRVIVNLCVERRLLDLLDLDIKQKDKAIVHRCRFESCFMIGAKRTLVHRCRIGSCFTKGVS
jgi:hypothetical protein